MLTTQCNTEKKNGVVRNDFMDLMTKLRNNKSIHDDDDESDTGSVNHNENAETGECGKNFINHWHDNLENVTIVTTLINIVIVLKYKLYYY